MNNREEEKKIFLVIDGNALIHSSYHISKKTWGTANNTIYFFLRSTIHILKSIKNCQKIIFFFDGEGSKSDGYRRKILPEYKINRLKLTDDFINEMNSIKILLKKLGFEFLQIKKNEADDLIASLVSSKSIKRKFNFVIWTKDKDMLQLIDDGISIFKKLTKGKAEIYEKKDFLKEYNFGPENFVDYLSLVGDSSDNIDGIKGIGKIKAKKLIAEYGNIENIYKNKETVMKKIKISFFDDEEKKSKRNKSLITLKNDILSKNILEEIENMEDFEWNEWKKNKNLIEYCKKKNFNSILRLITDDD